MGDVHVVVVVAAPEERPAALDVLDVGRRDPVRLEDADLVRAEIVADRADDADIGEEARRQREMARGAAEHALALPERGPNGVEGDRSDDGQGHGRGTLDDRSPWDRARERRFGRKARLRFARGVEAEDLHRRARGSRARRRSGRRREAALQGRPACGLPDEAAVRHRRRRSRPERTPRHLHRQPQVQVGLPPQPPWSLVPQRDQPDRARAR